MQCIIWNLADYIWQHFKNRSFFNHRPAASGTTAHNISRASTDTDHIQISMQSTDTMLQPQQVMSPTTASGCPSVSHQVMDQFTQMRTMLSSFLGQKQETTTCTAFCNYLASEVEELEEKEFQTFINEVVKLLSKHAKQGRRTWSAATETDTFMKLSATARFLPQTFQQTAPAAKEYILIIPETQMPSSQVIEPALQSQVVIKGQQQQSPGQPTSFLVIDDQLQTLQHSMMSYQQIDTPQLFSPANTPAPATSPQTTSISQQEHQQPPALPPSPLQSANARQQQQ